MPGIVTGEGRFELAKLRSYVGRDQKISPAVSELNNRAFPPWDISTLIYLEGIGPTTEKA